jgi:hypothetical protein
MKGTALLGCDVCSLVEVCQHFGGIYCSVIRNGEVANRANCLIDILFDDEDRGNTFFQDVDKIA